jgi:hypothetical protein
VAGPGWPTVADMKGNVGATREFRISSFEFRLKETLWNLLIGAISSKP